MGRAVAEAAEEFNTGITGITEAPKLRRQVARATRGMDREEAATTSAS